MPRALRWSATARRCSSRLRLHRRQCCRGQVGHPPGWQHAQTLVARHGRQPGGALLVVPAQELFPGVALARRRAERCQHHWLAVEQGHIAQQPTRSARPEVVVGGQQGVEASHLTGSGQAHLKTSE
jgi:hypothetical protein